MRLPGDPAKMSDDEFLAVFVPPELLLPTLHELASEALEELVGEPLTEKRGHLVKLDNAVKLSDADVMRAVNWARGELRLPKFPDLATYQRYNELRGGGIGVLPEEAPKGWVER